MKDTKARIQQAASELFADKGYKQTTIRDICKKAEVNIAAVNYHFKGKQGLIKSIIEQTFEKRSQQFQYLLQNQDVRNERDWKSTIYNFILTFISEPKQSEAHDDHLSKLFFRELNNPSDFFKAMHKKYFNPVDSQLKDYLRMGLPENTSDEQLSLWVVTIISQCGFFRRRHGMVKNITQIDFSKPEKVKMMADHISNTIFASLKYRG